MANRRSPRPFRAKGSLDEVDFGEDLDCAPGSIQPIVGLNEEGDRTLTRMQWGFKLPKAFLFNVRSEGVAKANFWKLFDKDLRQVASCIDCSRFG